MQLFHLKIKLQNHFDGILICNMEDIACFSPLYTPECLLLHCVTLAEWVRFHFQVNFMITSGLGSRHRRQSDNDQQLSQTTRSGAQVYKDLAQASGGQAIEITESELLKATSILTESASSSLVLTKCSHWHQQLL